MDEQAQHPGPPLPEQAVHWLCGDSQRTVLVHGIPQYVDPVTFVEQGHDTATVTSTSPQVPHRSADLVVVDQLPDDLTALARMLRPGGQLALLHTTRDRRIPWARKLDQAVGARVDDEPAGPLVLSNLFGFVDRELFRHWQPVNKESLTALLTHELSGDDQRESRTAAALELYADYGRGADGMQLPWVTTCYRATLVESVWETPHMLNDPLISSSSDGAGDEPRRSVDDDLPGEPTVPLALADLRFDDESRPAPGSSTSDDLLLIDFR